MTLSRTTYSRTTFSIMTLSRTTFSINDTQNNIKLVLIAVMLNVVFFIVILSVAFCIVMLSVISPYLGNLLRKVMISQIE
jgi:hypothetical protein